MDFEKQLTQVQQVGLSGAQQIEIDLSAAVNNKEYSIAGNYFYIKDAPSDSAYIDVRINSISTSAISWTIQTGFRHPFNKLYITTPAGQSGIMKIIIASESPELFEIIDNRSAISENMSKILAELQGDTTPENWGFQKTVGNTGSTLILAANADRKAFIVQAKKSNSGTIYIGFDDSVGPTKWVAGLQAGMAFSADDYRGAIYAEADTASQHLGWGEW